MLKRAERELERRKEEEEQAEKERIAEIERLTVWVNNIFKINKLTPLLLFVLVRNSKNLKRQRNFDLSKRKKKSYNANFKTWEIV